MSLLSQEHLQNVEAAYEWVESPSGHTMRSAPLLRE